MSFLVICSLVCAVQLPWVILRATPDDYGVFMVGNAALPLPSSSSSCPLSRQLSPWSPSPHKALPMVPPHRVRRLAWVGRWSEGGAEGRVGRGLLSQQLACDTVWQVTTTRGRETKLQICPLLVTTGENSHYSLIREVKMRFYRGCRLI